MRIIILLFLFSFTQPPAFLEGDYTDTYHGMIGARWHFSKDGTFSYSEANCQGGRIGHGVYNLQNDSVHFLFYPCTSPGIPSSLEFFRGKSEAQGWSLSFELIDKEKNEQVIFATIAIKDSTGTLLKAAQTDVDGRAVLHIPGYQGIIFIAVKELSYCTAELMLDAPGNYFVQGKMSSSLAHRQYPGEPVTIIVCFRRARKKCNGKPRRRILIQR